MDSAVYRKGSPRRGGNSPEIESKWLLSLIDGVNLSQLLHLGVTTSRISSRGGGDTVANEGRGFVSLWFEHGETLNAALVETFGVTYDSYKKTVSRESGDRFEQCPADVSEVVQLVRQDTGILMLSLLRRLKATRCRQMIKLKIHRTQWAAIKLRWRLGKEE